MVSRHRVALRRSVRLLVQSVSNRPSGSTNGSVPTRTTTPSRFSYVKPHPAASSERSIMIDSLYAEDHPSCEAVHELNRTDQCRFIINNKECHEDESFIAYSTFVYCAFGSGNVIPPLLVLAVGLVLLFVALGVTADDFLTPSLIAISKTLRLSQNIAGVTLLAFGNGAPDIISSIAGVGQARPALVVGELLGAGTFVTCVVVGSICLTQNFKIMERPFLRDIIFYIGATYWAFCTFYRQRITLITSIGFIVVYLIYIVVVVVSSIVYQKHKKKQAAKEQFAVSQDAFTQISHQINSISNGFDANDGFADSGNAGEDAEMSDDPEYVGLVLRRSSFRNYVRRRKTTLSGNRSRSNSRVSRRSSPGNSAPNSRANSRVNSRANSISSTTRSRANSVKRQNDIRINQLSVNYGFDNPVFTVTAATPTATPNHKEFKFPTNGDLSHSLTNGNSTKKTLVVEQSLSDGTKEAHDLEYIERPDAIDGTGEEEEKEEELTPLREFLTQVSPIDAEDWAEMNWFWRIFTLVKAPLYIVLALTTPVKDNDNNKSNWCRLLNTLHCVTSPLAICFITQSNLATVGDGFPVAVIVLLAGLCLAATVFFTSKHEEPPVYHPVFAFVGFVVSVSWVYMIANEVVSLLKTVGIVLELSDAFLGMTVLAWGNSIGDFIANLSVARQGYPRMAISACFGGPLLNLLLGFGLPYTYKLLSEDSGVIGLEYKWIIGLLYATVCQGLVSTMVVMFILGFESRKEFGVYLIALYVVFFSVTVVVEITRSSPGP